MNKTIIEQPIPMKAYFVERDHDGTREVCTLTRGVWNIAYTGKFFAYECDSVAVAEAKECECCGIFAMHTSSNGCENCFQW